MSTTTFVLLTGMFLTGPEIGSGGAASAGQVRVENCVVESINPVDVPAEEAGRLLSLEVREGMDVQAGALLGKTDDRRAAFEYRVACAERDAAVKEASSDVAVKVAEKAAAVAYQDWQTGVEANRKAMQAVAKTEILRRQFEYERANLSAEKAALDIEVAKYTADAKTHAADLAAHNVERRQIISQISGRVEEIVRRPGNWVMAGETVLRILPLDRLFLKGTLETSYFHQSDVRGKPVVVEAVFPGGRLEKFHGKVQHASSQVRGDTFDVLVEVENRVAGSDWLLFPGMHATMTIDLRAVEAPMAATKR
jgi:multidrug efflux pump subunit AcrA (membrane-fusion protein)